MDHRIADIQARLLSISEELGDVSIDVLRTALEDGGTSRPAIDKRLSQARRAVDKAAHLLDSLPAEED